MSIQEILPDSTPRISRLVSDETSYVNDKILSIPSLEPNVYAQRNTCLSSRFPCCITNPIYYTEVYSKSNLKYFSEFDIEYQYADNEPSNFQDLRENLLMDIFDDENELNLFFSSFK